LTQRRAAGITELNVTELDRAVTRRASVRHAVQRALLVSAASVPVWAMTQQVANAQTANQPPVANAGTYPTFPDTDGLPGELVNLNGSGSTDADGNIVRYVWTNAQGVQIATGPTPQVRLPDGANPITLTVTDDFDCQCSGGSANTGSQTVTITVAPTSAPVANAGGNRAVPDTDHAPGETVTLDGSRSSDADGSIATYQWFRNQTESLGSGAVLQGVRLPDGNNVITLIVTDNVGNRGSDTVTLAVNASAPREALADLAQLNPSEVSMARALDSLCGRLSGRASTTTLTPDQQDLLARCNGILFDPNTADQQLAVEELGAQDLNAIRTQALLFSNQQMQAVSARMDSLRRLRDSESTALNFNIGGQQLPLAELADFLRSALGGGASADDELLGNKLGFWLRGNHDDGRKRESVADRGFRATQWGVTGGVDYRLRRDTVLGASAGYGKSDVDFNPSGQGGLDSRSWTVSLYGSSYFLGNAFVDAVIDIGRPHYDSDRRVLYQESGQVIDRTATGSTKGKTRTAGISGGYDFARGPFTFVPSLGFYDIQTRVDAFRETGAGGLDLAYDGKTYRSSTANAGVRATYAWKLPWAVVIPQVSAQFVREFQKSVEAFGIRFANDPFADSSNPTPPIIVYTDVPDRSYWRVSAGFSAQFRHDISAYAEYQRLAQFQYMKINTFTVGVRFQRSLAGAGR
jgi:outer membrane autotransporter protein